MGHRCRYVVHLFISIHAWVASVEEACSFKVQRRSWIQRKNTETPGSERKGKKATEGWWQWTNL